MEDFINYDIRGMLNGKQIKRVQCQKAKTILRQFVGEEIDEFRMDITIKSIEDLEYLSNFLSYIKPCFREYK